MTRRLLLTGIGGSIGCHVFAHLMHNTNWTVVGIDSFRHKGLTDRVAVMLAAHPEWAGRLELHTHDLRAPISLALAARLGPLDYIISMAALSDVDASLASPAAFIHDNVQIATTVLDLARLRPDLTAFIQISTDEVYGPCGAEPHAEWSPILPSNPYAASKAAQEAIAISYWRAYGVPLIVTNTMNNFGEMQQSSKYPAILQRLISRGETVTVHGRTGEIGSRYYLHSRNFADALLFILRTVRPRLHADGELDRPERFNIVGDERMDNLALAQAIAAILDKPLTYKLVDFHASRPGHDRHYGLTGDRLANLGWKAPLSFLDSLTRTVRWTAEHPEWL